jgi:hypothetical protein
MSRCPSGWAALAITLLVPATASASSFRLLGARLEGDQVALDVCIVQHHTGGTVIDFFAHKRPARHPNAVHPPPQILLIREGLQVASFADLKCNERRNVTIRVPLAELQKQGFAAGDKLYLAANWVSPENSGSGHHYGALYQCTSDRYASTSCVIPAQQNAAFKRPAALRSTLLRWFRQRGGLPQAQGGVRWGHFTPRPSPWTQRAPSLGRDRPALGR